MKINYYRCYSINLQRFLTTCGIKAIHEKFNENTKKICWIYEMTEEFQTLLIKYTERRIKNNEKSSR